MPIFPVNILPSLSILLLYTALAFIATAQDPLFSTYERWMSDFGRVYSSEVEKQHRFEVFKTNFQLIESINKQPNITYTVGLNEFADLTNAEFKAKYVGFKSPSSTPKTVTPFMYANLTVAPTCIDWRSSGAVTPVKYDCCGASWATSATGAMEGINKIKTGSLVSLSEQELIDCVTSCAGCNGGYMDYAFQWVIYNGGITSESDYPCTGRTGTCNYVKTYDYVVSLLSYQDVTSYCESCLKNAVANQPVSVAVETSGSAFQFYKSGIFTGSCGTNLDHGMLVVGYGPCSTGTAYWIVKNSWGTSWGESGYIRMQRNVASTSGLCGIAMEPSYPTM